MFKADHSPHYTTGSMFGTDLLAAASTNDGRVIILSYDSHSQLRSTGEVNRCQTYEILTSQQKRTVPMPIMGPELSLTYDGHPATRK